MTKLPNANEQANVFGPEHLNPALGSEGDSANAPAMSPGHCRRPLDQYSEVTLAHGGGGKLTQELLDDLFLPAFGNATLSQLSDASVLSRPDGRIAFSTDSYVVQPLEFPGGSIGSLAVHGTINDLAMSGAAPIAISVAFILEEGLSFSVLRRIVDDLARAANEVGVEIVTGDTKVVERGRGDGCYINTSGIGGVPEGIHLGRDQIQVGDAVLVSGTLGDHGMAIMSCREGLEFDSTIRSDSAPLHELVKGMLAIDADIRILRDPTRGGAAASLNEICLQRDFGIEIENAAIPVRREVAAACEILGFDPLQVANEGKLIGIVKESDADQVLSTMRKFTTGVDACRVGTVVKQHAGQVVIRTEIGGKRILPMPIGQQLPRIC